MWPLLMLLPLGARAAQSQVRGAESLILVIQFTLLLVLGLVVLRATHRRFGKRAAVVVAIILFVVVLSLPLR